MAAQACEVGSDPGFRLIEDWALEGGMRGVGVAECL